MIRDIKVQAIIEKKQWVPRRMRTKRLLMRAAGRLAQAALEVMAFFRLKPRLALGVLASSVSNLPGGGGPAVQAEQKFLHVIGTFVLTGNYPGAPGDVFDVTLATLPPGYTFPTLGPIIMGWAQSINPKGVSGFSYTIVPGSTIRNATLDVQQGGGANAPNVEIASSGYAAGITGDTIQFEILIGIQ